MKTTIQLFTIILTLSVSTLRAQQENPERDDRIEAMKVAFITQKLDLSSAEAKVFWPVFNEYSSELKKLKEKEKENLLTFKAKTNPNPQESNKTINDHIAYKQAELDLIKKYVTEFKKVLPEIKVAKLIMIEHEFKQELLQRLKERREQHDKPDRRQNQIH